MGRNRLAVLIDADNAQAAICEALLAEISKLGVSTIKRAYGDWTTPNLAPWKEHLLRHAIHPVQQFSYTQGKNATDSALIIDAMDLLYSGNVEGFCLISSDSDFTRLAARLRESGMLVYGFGEDKTPQPFLSACDKFIYSEGLRKVAEKPVPAMSVNKPAAEPVALVKPTKAQRQLRSHILNAVNELPQTDGWTSLAALGAYLRKKMPDFTPADYGASKLGVLIQTLDYLDRWHRPVKGGGQHLYIRKKVSRPAKAS
ncbi:NYN domain-containing protein [Cobetia sp. UIB-001]